MQRRQKFKIVGVGTNGEELLTMPGESKRAVAFFSPIFLPFRTDLFSRVKDCLVTLDFCYRNPAQPILLP